MTSDVTKVRHLEFSDLYLGHRSLGDRFSDPSGTGAFPLPSEEAFRSDLEQLRQICREARQVRSRVLGFKVRYDEVCYRVSVMNTLGGEVYVLRRLGAAVPPLCATGIPQTYVASLLAKGLTGLFIIGGGSRSGKTTTACALLKERLEVHGGVAVTSEDPIELPLEGAYGKGVCYQTTSPSDPPGIAGTFRNVERWGARMILVDEIRDPETAVELLKAGLNGYLIFTTMLAENVVQAITKLHALINEKLGSDSAQALLANGLGGVLHLHPGSGPNRKPETEFLLLRDAAKVRTILRNGNYEVLSSEIKQQMATLITRNATVQRVAEG